MAVPLIAGALQLSEFLGTAWLLSRLVDRCYRRVPSGPGTGEAPAPERAGTGKAGAALTRP